MANRPMSRCSISLIIREMQIKTKMRDHLIAVIMVIIKESTNNKCRRGYKEKTPHLLLGCVGHEKSDFSVSAYCFSLLNPYSPNQCMT